MSSAVNREGGSSERPSGSFSKLRTLPDGMRVLLRLFLLLRSYKPLTLFGSLAIVLFLATVAAGALPAFELFTHHRVDSRACAILALSGFMLTSLCLALGLVLSSVNLRLLELERVVIKRIKNARAD